mmetsp:Transcript_151/g.190  ORF Transcript_151/g.190 Transcript_151/m.190 type:complete len:111 (+) Transcript_151:1543-1875(+)
MKTRRFFSVLSYFLRGIRRYYAYTLRYFTHTTTTKKCTTTKKMHTRRQEETFHFFFNLYLSSLHSRLVPNLCYWLSLPQQQHNNYKWTIRQYTTPSLCMCLCEVVSRSTN